ncbi:MAG: TldD/PmbA family protein [Nitrospirae bacterium]|nr:TldD/PmbA family protein [Nitrospirota bacterium]
MINEELSSELLKTALKHGGEYADIYFEDRSPQSIQLEDNKVEKILSGIDKGVGIRVIFGGKTAYAYTNDLTHKSLIECAASVSRAVKGNSTDLVINLQRQRPKVDFVIKKLPSSISMDDKLALVTRANIAARGIDNTKIRQVSIVYRDISQDVVIANSEGIFCSDSRVHIVFVAHVIAADGDIVQTGYEVVGGFKGFELFDEENVSDVAEIAAKRAVDMLSARKIKGGAMPVVISSEAGGTMVHEAIGHGLEADLAQQGLSVYSQKLGQKIASELITVIDDATIPGNRGSFRFDDEGTLSAKNILVKDGILTSYMYDRLTAMKDGCSSTGNGRRESYHHKPIPRMTNTYLAQGKHNSEDIIKSVKNGLFVKKMGGGQVNTVTGDFVFEVSLGYEINDGVIGDMVRGATLSGNGPEILNSIDMIASDIGFAIGTCGKDGQGAPVSDAMPTVRIPKIVVGGEV